MLMENKANSIERDLGKVELEERPIFGAVETMPSDEQVAELSGSVERKEQEVAMELPPELPRLEEMEDVSVSVAPEVTRDAEHMPKKYATYVIEIAKRLSKDPYALQQEVSKLKWDYMKKAFDRDLGKGSVA